MNNTVRTIAIGTVSGLIASGILKLISIIWEIKLQSWLWFAITAGTVILLLVIWLVIRKCRIHKLISEFNECSLGDSYVYTWDYKRSRKGRYSAYGYEATNIRTKVPLSVMNHDNVYTFGHEVPEETIKIFIQLCMISSIDKTMRKMLKPALEYMNWIEDSQKHPLLH